MTSHFQDSGAFFSAFWWDNKCCVVLLRAGSKEKRRGSEAKKEGSGGLKGRRQRETLQMLHNADVCLLIQIYLSSFSSVSLSRSNCFSSGLSECADFLSRGNICSRMGGGGFGVGGGGVHPNSCIGGFCLSDVGSEVPPELNLENFTLWCRDRI